MARKLGDIGIAIIILTFVIGVFSTFIINADTYTQTSSGVVGDSLQTIGGDITGDKAEFISQFNDLIDNASILEPDPNVQIESDGNDAFSWANIGSKNIISAFVKELAQKIPGSAYILGFIGSLLAFYITILLLRVWRGDNKI